MVMQWVPGMDQKHHRRPHATQGQVHSLSTMLVTLQSISQPWPIEPIDPDQPGRSCRLGQKWPKSWPQT